MNRARIVLRLALLLTPAGGRERAAEEWHADLGGCEELGVSALSLAVGAFTVAASARVRLIARAVQRVTSAASPVLVGLLVGAICAVGDVSVLAVFTAPALIQIGGLVVGRWRLRSRRAVRLP